MGDAVCDLECQEKKVNIGRNRHEFVGPVKIVLIESTPVDYKRKVWGSAIFTFVMLLMGATVFTVFFFTLKFKLPFALNVHVLLCTMGFQLLMTTGIMMFSTLFGASMHLKPAERKFQHFLLEIAAVFFGTLGTLFALAYMQLTLHAITGLLATFFSILSCFVGPTVQVSDPENLYGKFNKRAHTYVSVFSFILCTVSFCLGLMQEGFIKDMPLPFLNYILISFAVIYCVTALYY